MGEQGFWTRWAGRLSAGLLGAAGAHAGPVLQRVRAGGDVRAEAADVPLRLDAHDLLRVRHAAGAHVQALYGHLWITQDGDPRDVMLAPGESFRLDRRSPALIAPLDGAQVLVSTGAPGR